MQEGVFRLGEGGGRAPLFLGHRIIKNNQKKIGPKGSTRNKLGDPFPPSNATEVQSNRPPEYTI